MSTHTADYRPASDVTMAELFPNHDGLRPAAVDALAGSTLDLHWVGGGVTTLSFTADAAEVTTVTPAGEWILLDGTLTAEVVELRAGFLGAALHDPRTQSSYFLVVGGDHAVLVHTRMSAGPTGATEDTRVLQAGIGGPAASVLARTDDLVGKRVFWRYSDTHSFEHIYLEPNRYCWHGLTGPEAGMGGVEPTSAYRLADGLVLFTWSDTSVAFNGTIVIDFDGDTVTSKGRLFGWEAAERAGQQIIVGAGGRVLNSTDHAGL
ncbi:MoaF C-terminal domain-containing protein [Streptomyces sp. NPDC048282]|uniref:MoaF C-terminal domain-containing protein n=1 Tax=Streptomyces sp. NPDC048282 TaxID=3365528 RepID=UPI00372395E6